MALPAQLTQSLQLAFRIAFVWAGGFLLAVAVRALLPDQFGFTIGAKQGPVFLSFSRIGYWTCLWAALTVSVLVLIRATIGDFASASAR